MRHSLLTTVAAAALSLGVATAMAQSGPPGGGSGGRPEMAPSQGSSGAGAGPASSPPGRSAAPSANRPAAPGAASEAAPGRGAGGSAQAPGRSEAAPGQGRGETATSPPGRSESAPGRSPDEAASDRGRSGSDSAGDRQRAGTSAEQQQGADRERQRAGSERDRNQQAGSERRDREEAASGRDRDRQQAGPERERDRQRADRPDRERGQRAGSDEADRSRRTGAAQPDREQRERAATGDSDRTRTGRSESGQASAERPRDSSSGALASADLPQEKRTEIRETLVRRDVKPVTNVNFSVSVGTSIPQRVRVYDLPPSIVEIVPQYRGYRYTVVRDEIVIINPRTRKIVEVIDRDVSSSRTASVRASSGAGSLSLTQEQRTTVSRTLRSDAATTIRVGSTVPACVELSQVPQRIVSEVPELRSYRYFAIGEEIAIVEPESRKIVEIIQ